MSVAAVAPRLSSVVAGAGRHVSSSSSCQTALGHRWSRVFRGVPLSARTASSSSASAGPGSEKGEQQQRLQRQPSPPPPPPFPVVVTCPEPTCTCEPMPDMPPDLPIDYKGPLRGLITAYNEQVLVCTGKDDWPSRIEDDSSGDNLAADLKELFGRGGKYSDPYHNVAVVNASFASSVPLGRPELQNSSVYLLPSFIYVPFLPRVSFDSVDALAKGFLLPERLHPAHDGRLSPVHRDCLTAHPAYRRLLWGVRHRVDDVFVLICGHGGRDARCGILGPVLRIAFEQALTRVGIEPQQGPVVVDSEEEDDDDGGERLSASLDGPDTQTQLAMPRTARIGLISHIGGHKFAGNVILYLPPSLCTADGTAPHPLAGYGIWYGRVEPQHVEGLVNETILRGNVVTDHFRGAINRNREIIR